MLNSNYINMYIAKKKNTEINEGIPKVYVDFTNGTNTFTEWCVPSDDVGLRFWVKSRLAVYNATPVINTTYADGAVIDVSDPVVTPPELTPAEIARNTWLTKYRTWVKIKTTVVDTGIVPITNTKIANMLADLKATLLPEYIDYI